MTGFVILAIIALLIVVAVQIGRISELSAKIRDEAAAARDNNNFNAAFGVVFMVAFLVFCVASAIFYKNYMIGYGPLQSASKHGSSIDYIFNLTLFFTGIVFFLTQFALFWYAYKYREQTGRKVLFLPHDNRLEVIWTAVPAVVMCGLVVGGLWAWNDIMADVKEGEDFLEIEATGQQFFWTIRYPGADNAIGTKNFRLIHPGENDLGQDWKDAKNLDDFSADDVVLPVGKKIRVRITAKDVLHNFYLPHFRVKMDAIPGLPTYFVFTPTMTTEQYRQELKKYPEYNVPSDPADPNSPRKWEVFNYELACAELCGKGHFSMRKKVMIVSSEEYQKWAKSQKSIYEQTVKGKPFDPFLNAAAAAKGPKAFSAEAVEAAMKDTTNATLQLNNVTFATGSAQLTPESTKELDILLAVMNKYPKMVVEIDGHTDNVGDEKANLALSVARAKAVEAYAESKGVDKKRMQSAGFGGTKPIADNATAEGKQQNRRTEFRIIGK
jgi:cytochrome c oxidase subunit II